MEAQEMNIIRFCKQPLEPNWFKRFLFKINHLDPPELKMDGYSIISELFGKASKLNIIDQCTTQYNMITDVTGIVD